MSTPASPLNGVKVILFDTFGTLVDWETSISRALKAKAKRNAQARAQSGAGVGGPVVEGIDWLSFTREWRAGYMRRTKEIAHGAPGPGNIDDLHLEVRLASPFPLLNAKSNSTRSFCFTEQILNDLLENSSQYSAAEKLWAHEADRKKLCQLWHKLEAWPDVQPGLGAIRKLDPPMLLATLSNGTLRLLIDLARHNSLVFDAHFSGDLLGAFKPNPKMYLGASSLLGFDEDAIRRGEVAMCASHIYDLRAAGQLGLKTIYVPRKTEDRNVEGGGAAVKTKEEGGEVDVVVKGLEGLLPYLR
ncbi:SPOSA6832_04822, partial [Sporobolomyces salmonicolor]